MDAHCSSTLRILSCPPIDIVIPLSRMASYDIDIMRRGKFYVPRNTIVKRIFFKAPLDCGNRATNGIDIFRRVSLAVKPAHRLLSYDIGGSHITVGLCLLEP